MTISVLVTGGAGYLGSILVPALLSKGFSVTVLDRFPRGDTALASCCANLNFRAVKGDCRDERTVAPLLKDADIVIPLAALVGAPLCASDPLNAATVNRDAVQMIARLASDQQLLLLPTTNSGYGIGETGQFCTEDTPLRPISLYGRTKMEAENSVLEKRGISLRLATVFGMAPSMRVDLLVNDFTYRAVTDLAVVLFESHFKRNYIHIRDVTNAFLHMVESAQTLRGNAFNVGLSDANLSKRELCERIQKHVPAFVFFESAIGEDPDKRDYIVSNAKIEGTGFRPQHTLDDGIRELIKGYTMLSNKRYANA